MKIKEKLKLYIFHRQLNKLYPESQIKILNCFNPKRLEFGRYSYGEIGIVAFNNNSKIKVGSFCSIAQEVKFLLDADHSISTVSSYPFKVKMLGTLHFEATSKGDIIVEDDVWIGYGATIMSGVHIGQGAVVAAGAVVTKDVPPYAIVGGVPAKVIKYRFSPELIEELLKIDYGKLSKEDIEKHIDDLYTELKDPSQLEWMPKKGESRV